MFITYIDHGIGYEKLIDEMREICGFHRNYPFTVKWVDEEGDPCTVSSQIELDEAIRLYEINKEAELTVHGRTIAIGIHALGDGRLIVLGIMKSVYFDICVIEIKSRSSLHILVQPPSHTDVHKI